LKNSTPMTAASRISITRISAAAVVTPPVGTAVAVNWYGISPEIGVVRGVVRSPGAAHQPIAARPSISTKALAARCSARQPPGRARIIRRKHRGCADPGDRDPRAVWRFTGLPSCNGLLSHREIL
jgi:hypothetical protein